ncbi:MAG: ribosome silencing factor [Verrucomicrobiota bacterium]
MKKAPSLDARKIAKLCRTFAEDKKAVDIVVLDVREVSSVADYILICSGGSEPHLKAIADNIDRQLRDAGVRTRHHDGYPKSRWVVMDYGDVMVHIFHPTLREHYDLERLWGDGKRVK